MKRKWHKGQYGVESLDVESEFVPRQYRSKVVGLRQFGVPYVPVVGMSSFQKYEEPSSWHVHAGCVEFILCTAGTCVYESGESRFRLKPGMMFVSREDEGHRQLDCPKGFSMMFLHFQCTSGRHIRWFDERFRAIPRLFACSRSVAVRFTNIFTLAESRRQGDDLQIRLLVEVQSLLLAILDSAVTNVKRAVPDFVDVVARRMKECPMHNYSLDELAVEGGMSKTTFITLFKASLGNSPHSYLLGCRVEAAKRLLRKGVAVKDVAERLGFSSARVLSRTFKNFEGVPPAEWLARR